MTRKEYDNLKGGETVYFVSGGYPDCSPYIEVDKCSGKEKYNGHDMVSLAEASWEAVPYRYCFLTIEKARKALKRQLKKDEELEREDYEEMKSVCGWGERSKEEE